MINLPKKTTSGQRLDHTWLNRLVDAVRQLQVQGDEKTIRVSRSTGGTVISAIPQDATSAGGGDEYEGFFLTSITDTNKVTVAEGRVIVGDEEFTVSETEITISDNGTNYIYIPITYTRETQTTDVGTMAASTSEPNNTDSVVYPIIATCEFDGNSVSDLKQQLHGAWYGGGTLQDRLTDEFFEDLAEDPDLLDKLAGLLDADGTCGSGDCSGKGITYKCQIGNVLENTYNDFVDAQTAYDSLDLNAECDSGTSCGNEDSGVFYDSISSKWKYRVINCCCDEIYTEYTDMGSYSGNVVAKALCYYGADCSGVKGSSLDIKSMVNGTINWPIDAFGGMTPGTCYNGADSKSWCSGAGSNWWKVEVYGPAI